MHLTSSESGPFLVVDDEPEIRRLVFHTLSPLGHAVLLAKMERWPLAFPSDIAVGFLGWFRTCPCRPGTTWSSPPWFMS